MRNSLVTHFLEELPLVASSNKGGSSGRTSAYTSNEPPHYSHCVPWAVTDLSRDGGLKSFCLRSRADGEFCYSGTKCVCVYLSFSLTTTRTRIRLSCTYLRFGNSLNVAVLSSSSRRKSSSRPVRGNTETVIKFININNT